MDFVYGMHFYHKSFYRSAPPIPRHKLSTERRTEKLQEKSEPESVTSSVNSSVTSLASYSATASVKSLQSLSETGPLSSPPAPIDVFVYEDVDGLGANSHSRDLSFERDHTSFPLQKTMASSESVPSFATHVTPTDKGAGKIRSLKKLLSRSSKKKISSSLSSQSCEYDQCSMVKHLR